MAIIIFAAAWFALRYRQSNYEPPESTVTVTPPPAIQGAPSADQPASIAPAAPVTEQPSPSAEQPVMTTMSNEEIGGIGTFNTIAGDTMFDFDPAPAPAPPPAPEVPAPAMEQVPPPAPEVPAPTPAPAMEQVPPPAPPVSPATGVSMYTPPPPEHSLDGDGEIEMYTRSGYAEL